jgi:hypothetical protein
MRVRPLEKVRRLIRNKRTGMFLEDGHWTHDRHKARHYECISEAMKACDQHSLKDVELVLTFGDPKMDIPLPLC